MVTMHWYKEELETLKSFVKEGKSLNYIARAFNTSVSNIKVVCHRKKIVISKLRKKNLSGSPSKFERKFSKGDDLTTRIRILKGEELRKDKPTHFFSDKEIKRWLNGAEGCDIFCKEVLKVELQDYQIDAIKKMLNRKRVVAIMGRQTGKDFLCSCFVVWKSIIDSNSKILLISASQRASDLLYNRILTFIGSSNELFDSVEKSNMEICKFKNNSEIWSLPATGQIRGQTEVTHIICNEAFEIPDEAFSAIEPMLAIRNGHLYLFSTPRGCVGKLWNTFNNPFYEKIHLPSTINKYLSKEWVELQKNTMPALEFDMEVNANFQQSVDCYFPIYVLEQISYDYSLHEIPQPDKDYYCGIDWGRIQDSSVITIISKDKEGFLKVENIIEKIKTPFSEQVALICKLHQNYGFENIISEYAGLSISPSEQLKEKGLPVDFFKPTIDSKEQAFNYLKKQMENKKLMIPKNHQKLQYELRMFQYQITSSGKTKLFHLSRGSDDFCDSLNYSVWATKEPKYEMVSALAFGHRGWF